MIQVNEEPVSEVRLDHIQFENGTANLNVGDVKNLSLIFVPSNATDKTVSWESSDPTIVSVENGLIKAKKVGTAIITATAKDGGSKAQCFVTVKEAQKVTKVKPSYTKKTTSVGKKFSLTASVLPTNAANTKVRFTTSSSKIVAITSQSSKGKANLTAKRPGIATITVQSLGNTKAKATVTITVKPAKVTSVKYKAGTTSVKLSWKAQSGVKGYQVYRYDSKTKKYKLYKTVKGNSLTASKLKRKTSYKFKVRAYAKSGSKVLSGDFSSVATVKTK
ncbi:MAG: Ig domain-containing protein [Lachnospiraceae bacterium]